MLQVSEQSELHHTDMLASTDLLLGPSHWVPPYVPTPVEVYTGITPFIVPPPFPPLPVPTLPPLPPPIEEPIPPPPPPLPDDLPPPPPPPGVPLESDVGTTETEGSIRSDEQRISGLAQFFLKKQESVHKDVCVDDMPQQLLPDPQSTEQMSPLQKQSEEEVASCGQGSSPYSSSSVPAVLTSQTVNVDKDAEDEDEEEMRNQLLRSLEIRRREKNEVSIMTGIIYFVFSSTSSCVVEHDK